MSRQRKMMKRMHKHIIVGCLPGIAGFLLFYLFPFFESIKYAFFNDAYHKEFVWFKNYFSVLNNLYFRQAMQNTLLFSFFGISVLLLVSFALCYLLVTLNAKVSYLSGILLMPMFLPTASVIDAWKSITSTFLWDKFAGHFGIYADTLPIYGMFIWRNTGINVLLLTLAVSSIPSEILDAAAIDGVKGIKRFFCILMPLSVPTIIFVGILSLVNSMKIFKESYFFYETGYPPETVYTIQYFMNNHFQKLNYQVLSCAASIIATILGVLIFVVYWLKGRNDKGAGI